MAACFARQVRARPRAKAILAADHAITYAELDGLATDLAARIRGFGVGLETPVAVLTHGRVDHIVTQVALSKLGATCVPIDPKYPDERVALMIAQAEAELLITDEAEPRVEVPACLRLGPGADLAGPPPASLPVVPVPARGESRTHILYTSGSSGRPKGVQIVARAITRLVINTNYVQLEPGDRVGQLASFCFDASLLELWGPLLCGATIVPLFEDRVVDPQALRSELAARRIDVMFLTTALFNITAQTCPDAFRGLRSLLIGGERADPRALRAVLEAAPPKTLWNGYGPTESTVFATAHRVQLEDLEGERVPIGRPLHNTRVFILGPDMTPVPQGSPGELCIGGDGLARGYLDAERTRERFVTVEGLDPRGPIRVYRSGDWAAWRSDGTLDFLGRKDFQVKLRGFRIELEEVESALLESGQLRSAVVAVEHSSQRLIAWGVPNDPSSFDPAALLRRLRATMPAYMVPAQLRLLERMPLTTNGKIDRAAVAALTKRAPARVAKAAAGAEVGPLVAEIWVEILGEDDIHGDDDFFALGGESLLAARLVLRLQEVLGVRVPVNALYAASTLDAFTARVQAALAGELPQDFGQGDASMWRRDAELPAALADQIREQAEAGVEPLGALEAKTILLTGATGFLGAFLLRELLDRSEAEIICLVRGQSEARGAARIEATLRKYRLWKPGLLDRVHPLLGDLRARALGLSDERHAALARELDLIIHNGAYVNYAKPYDSHRATNVLGTLEILELAARERLKPVHYLSTIAVFGPCGRFGGVERVHEADELDDFAEALRYDIGYSQSKWAGEQLIWAARSCGAPVCVYRPGFIMGDARTGVGNPDDFMARLVAGCVQVGAAPDLPRQRKEFVPVDQLSQLLINIAARPKNLGRAFHLVPPDPRRSVDLNDFFEMVADAGYPLERLPYAAWVDRLLADPRLLDNALLPVLPMLCERIFHDSSTRWELYEDMPIYDARQARAQAEAAGIELDAMTPELLSRYLAAWTEAGLLAEHPQPASARAARPGTPDPRRRGRS